MYTPAAVAKSCCPAPPYCVVGTITLKHCNQVAMSEHGPRNARRAAGVLQHSQIISVENHCAVWRFVPAFNTAFSFSAPGIEKAGTMRFTYLTKKLISVRLLRVQICDFGDHNGLDLRAGQDCGRRLRHIGRTTMTFTFASLS